MRPLLMRGLMRALMRTMGLAAATAAISSQSVWADNPAGALSDIEVTLIQQTAMGCPGAVTALRENRPSLARDCPSPTLPAQLARPVVAVGHMNGVVRACDAPVWTRHFDTVMQWASSHSTQPAQANLKAVYNAGHMIGMISVQDGRFATACLDPADYSMHYFTNNIEPLLEP